MYYIFEQFNQYKMSLNSTKPNPNGMSDRNIPRAQTEAFRELALTARQEKCLSSHYFCRKRLYPNRPELTLN